ncbi:MAG: DUF1338 domain-containing protein [Oleispira sp.]|nr:DUF1338 domain-containing protein [Oleispira sp.]
MKHYSIKQFLTAVWQDYLLLTPQVKIIQAALKQHNRVLINDHIAFRTFDIPAMDMSTLETHLVSLDYKLLDNYHFPEKHLSASAYIHPDPSIPKIFLSQLHIDQLSEQSQQIISHQLSIRSSLPTDNSIFYCGRCWGLPSWEEYLYLRQESEYAAWLITLGFHANHFTLDMNAFNSNSDRPLDWLGLIKLMESSHISMNPEGGIIKGSPEVLLEQASTLADEIQIDFDQGVKTIKGCFYEFAKRFKQEDGQEYQGFVAANANKIFSSTNSA